MQHRAANDSTSEDQSQEKILVVDGDDDSSDADSNPEPDRVENNSPEPEASDGESQWYPSQIHRPRNWYGLYLHINCLVIFKCVCIYFLF